MRLSGAARAALGAGAVAVCTLGGTLALAEYMQRGLVSRPSSLAAVKSPQNSLVGQGQHLFLMNCAHCHGDDATGDEGPDLHDVHKSDQRIHQLITNGVQGKMPSFAKKLNDADIRALTAYLRTLHANQGDFRRDHVDASVE